MSTFTGIKQRLVGPGDKLVGESKSSGAPLGNWGRFYLARNDGIKNTNTPPENQHSVFTKIVPNICSVFRR